MGLGIEIIEDLYGAFFKEPIGFAKEIIDLGLIRVNNKRIWYEKSKTYVELESTGTGTIKFEEIGDIKNFLKESIGDRSIDDRLELYQKVYDSVTKHREEMGLQLKEHWEAVTRTRELFLKAKEAIGR